MKSKILISIISLAAPLFAVTVVIPQNPSTFERTAANELVEHLDRAYGSKTALVAEGEAAKAPCIYVGNTKFAGDNAVDTAKFAEEEWALKSAKDGLIVSGGSPRGVIYAAYELLERCYGVLWLDEYCTVVPKFTGQFPDNLDLHGQPDFKLRCIYGYFKEDPTSRWLWQMRNRQNFFHDEERKPFREPYGVFGTYGSPRACHTYYDYSKEWSPEDDDCFSMNAQGQRVRAKSGSGPGQFCHSNPKTVTKVLERLRQYIEEDRKNFTVPPLLYEISQNDNDNVCQCKNCQELIKKYGTYSALVLDFMNKVGEQIAVDHPEIKIQMFSYVKTVDAPQGIKARDNVIVRIAQLGTEFGKICKRDTMRPLDHPNNQYSMQNIRDWSKIATLSIWDYWILYGKTGTAVCHEAIPYNLRFYKENNVTNFFVEQEKPFENPFYILRMWLGYRFLNNTSLSLEEETSKFMNAYYGEKAAPVMLECLKYIIARNNEVKTPLGLVIRKKRHDMDKEFFTKTRALLTQALKLAEKPEYAVRIRRERFVLNNENRLKNESKTVGGIDAIMEEINLDYDIVAPLWLSSAAQATFKKELATFMTGLKLKLPLPDEFKDMDVAWDICWPQMYKNNGSVIVDMPDAAGGKALQYKEKDPNIERPISFGCYDTEHARHIRIVKLKPEEMPKDEKFHFYNLGRITISARTYVWTHYGSCIQRALDEFYDPDHEENNVYDAYMSYKAEGPAYVPGSTKPSTLSVDRIFLVRPKK